MAREAGEPLSTARAITATLWRALGGADATLEALSFIGAGELPAAFQVTAFASAAVAAAALSIAELRQARERSGEFPRVVVDRRRASLWFRASLQPMGWALPSPWDPIAGDYRARDGWIRLHTNAPHHRAAAQRVLGPHTERSAVARAVESWEKAALEAAVVEAGGCAAEMRTTAEWEAHPQGRAVGAEPLVSVSTVGSPGATPSAAVQSAERADCAGPAVSAASSAPLAGVRVLDLTRVLAGPVATRFLAGYGAQVLRIDPPEWDEPAVVPEVTLGKRCARLDLRAAEGRARFEALLAQTDVLVHGYRPGALAHLGYDAAALRRLAPALIDVCLDAYGWSGPWAARRGFDSLVQMSCGIAAAGMRWRGADAPVPLPVQALDHASGYLLAAAAVRGLSARRADGRGRQARVSLARSARLLVDEARAPEAKEEPALAPPADADWSTLTEATSWGAARRLLPPVDIQGAAMQWSLPASALGSAAPFWAP